MISSAAPSPAFYGPAKSPASTAASSASTIDKAIDIDQTPSAAPRARTPSPAPDLSPIRHIFAIFPDSRDRGYKLGRFSFNVKGGRCEPAREKAAPHRDALPRRCLRRCEVCHGRRYNQQSSR